MNRRAFTQRTATLASSMLGLAAETSRTNSETTRRRRYWSGLEERPTLHAVPRENRGRMQTLAKGIQDQADRIAGRLYSAEEWEGNCRGSRKAQ